jgi:hypothetical protein
VTGKAKRCSAIALKGRVPVGDFCRIPARFGGLLPSKRTRSARFFPAYPSIEILADSR